MNYVYIIHFHVLRCELNCALQGITQYESTIPKELALYYSTVLVEYVA